MKKKYFITTAIAYSSVLPHIGNVYETILADALARFKRLDGFDVLFQTGTDEHGQKIEDNARKNEISPQVYVDLISKEIKAIYDTVDISYDKFVRTTDQYHVATVQKCFKKLYEKGDIYLSQYEGWYSISEEAYVSESDLIDGKTISGDIPVWTKEDAYFLNLQKYQERLIKHIHDNPGFIEPESRKNEIIQGFLNEPLHDLCVSRTSVKWGIPVDFANGHVVYVWFDALLNYITGLKYDPDQEVSSDFSKYWPADIHLIGKDVLRFHVIYWPIILMALDLPLPKKIFGHPWILFNKEKMSKSKGNVLYTGDFIKHFGVDVLRYFCLHEIPFAQDGNMTYELVIERNNSDLANTIGNLVNRTIGMVNKYRSGCVKKVILEDAKTRDLKKMAMGVLPKIREHIDSYSAVDALEEIMIFSRYVNKYIDESEPWKLYKTNSSDILDGVLYNLLESIRYIAVLLQPFLPRSAIEIARQINTDNLSFESLLVFGGYESLKVNEASVIFERFDILKKLGEIEKDIDELS